MARGRRDSPVSFFSFQDVMVCTIGLTLLITLLLILQVGTSAATAAAGAAPIAIAEPDDETAAEAESLRRRLAELEARFAQDPNEELARIRSRLRALDGDLRRLRLEIETADETLAEDLRVGSLDADEAVAEALVAKRDRMKEDLAAIEARRRIVYLVAPDEPHPPTVAELSAARSVISFDQEREAPIALAASDPQQQAQRILEVFTSRRDWRDRTLLLVLKPSGLATYRAILEAIASDPRFAEVVLGLDLVGEDRFTSDAFPSARPAGDPVRGEVP
ncbi:MAG: hypothetical protein ACO3SJ_01985 [Phycisphaerales bacterium]|jgi:hypothetical protein